MNPLTDGFIEDPEYAAACKAFDAAGKQLRALHTARRQKLGEGEREAAVFTLYDTLREVMHWALLTASSTAPGPGQTISTVGHILSVCCTEWLEGLKERG